MKASGSFECQEEEVPCCWGAVPRTGQDNNNLKKTGGPRLGREGSRGDPRSGVKNPSPGLLLPPRKEQRRLED